MKKFALLILPFLFSPTLSFANSCGDIQGAVYIRNYDGDTITFNLPGLHLIIGENISIRVNGIDTLEIKGKCVQEKYNAQQVYYETHYTDLKESYLDGQIAEYDANVGLQTKVVMMVLQVTSKDN